MTISTLPEQDLSPSDNARPDLRWRRLADRARDLTTVRCDTTSQPDLVAHRAALGACLLEVEDAVRGDGLLDQLADPSRRVVRAALLVKLLTFHDRLLGALDAVDTRLFTIASEALKELRQTNRDADIAVAQAFSAATGGSAMALHTTSAAHASFHDLIWALADAASSNADFDRGWAELAARISAELNREAHSAFDDRDVVSSWPAALTRREREVMRLLLDGQSNAAIARELVVSLETVKSHVKNILRKSDVRNRAELIARFVRR